MKKSRFILSLLLLCGGALAPITIQAQGTLVYDQQSADDSYYGSGVLHIQPSQPMGQSFTPAMSGIDFVRLHLSDSVNDGLGATVRVNLRANSVSGSVLASTASVALNSQFIGAVNFLFSSTVSLTPGTKYYLQPEVFAGGVFAVASYNTFGYTGGDAYSNGTAMPGFDLWFREGIIVPEPTTAALIGVASVLGWLARPRRGLPNIPCP